MSLPGKDDRKCDRCRQYGGTAYILSRHVPNDIQAPLLSVCADLCKKCTKIVDKAIQRAVKPK